jgi:hypothetical protein
MDLPGVTASVYLQYLQQAGREFAEQSRAFRGPLDPLPVTDYQQDYDLKTAYAYDAHVLQLLCVRMNGVPIPLSQCALLDSRWLQLAPAAVAQDLTVERLLTCGASPKTAYTDWTGLTAGYYTITVNSSTYECGPCDCSGCLSMDDVARVLETAWRDAQSYPNNYVSWNEKGTNKFLFYTDSGEISYLTAGTSGTDISGALYLNGLTGTAAIAPMLQVDAVLLPDMRSDILPDWFLDRYGITIAAGAVAKLAGMRGPSNRPNRWYNPELAAQRASDYRRGLAKAKLNVGKQDRNILEPIL